MSSCPFCESPLPADAAASGSSCLGACLSCYNPVLRVWENSTERVGRIPGAHDVRRIAPADSIASGILQATGAHADDLPVLPEISQRILLLLKDPEFGMSALATLIRQDPVSSLAIMKQANSAAFGGLTEIKDLNAACARLGMKTVANTIQMVANRNLFITGDPKLKTGMERLWRHSVATAQSSYEIARATLAPDPETIFLAGLIHDIGKVLLLEMAASPRSAAVREIQSNPELLRELMDRIHALVGLLICQAWKLPPVLRAAVYFHHGPDLCPVKEWLPAVHMIALGNTIARVEGYGMYDTTGETFLATHPSTLYLNLTDLKLATLRVDLSDTLDSLFTSTG